MMDYKNTQSTAEKSPHLRGYFEQKFDGRQITVPKKLLENLGEEEKIGMLVFDDRLEYKKLCYIPEETYVDLSRQAEWQENNEGILRVLDTALITSIADGKLVIPEAYQKAAEVEPGTVFVTGRGDRINIFGAGQHQIQQNLAADRNIYDQPEDYE